ncbi:MAG: tetratricopeptide repeat protein [Eubacterium sp.]|nr:tetratricopeptide repeat protein [Eubacterium sp.]
MSKEESGKENMTRNEKREEKKLRRLEKQEKKRIEKMEDKARIAAEKKKDREEFWKIEDPIGFMRIINVTCVILAIFALFLSVRYIINLVFLVNYNNEIYTTSGEEFLTKLNIPEGYVPYYNIGNADYMNGNYDNAISNYKSALECHPTEKRECDIRVNLALAMLHKIDFDHLDSEKQKANAIRTLQAARKILCEKGCADPYGTDGHDPEAEQLKQDIDKMLEELGTKPETDQGDEADQQQSKGGKGDEQQKTKREQQLQEDLEKQKQDAMEERRDADNEKSQTGQKTADDSSGGGPGDGSAGDSFDGKTW